MVTRATRQAGIAKPKGRVARLVRLLCEIDGTPSEAKSQAEDRPDLTGTYVDGVHPVAALSACV